MTLRQDLETARLNARQAACEHRWWNASQGSHQAIAKCELCGKVAYNMLAHLHPDDPREIRWRQRLQELAANDKGPAEASPLGAARPTG